MTGLVMAAVVLAACEEAPSLPGIQVDTLPSGRVVVANPDVPLAPDGPPLRLVEELRIGSVDGGCDAFGSVVAMAEDEAGRIYVADFRNDEISIFTPTGECLRSFGGEGEGPGEFRMLSGIAWQPPGFLWAKDPLNDRLTVFDSLGAVLVTHTLERSLSASIPWRGSVDRQGHLHDFVLSRVVHIKYGIGPDLVVLDTLPAPETPVPEPPTYTQTSGGIAMMSYLPHSPDGLWAVDHDGHIWRARTDLFELHETTYDGDTLRTVRLARSPERLEGRERDSIAAATGVRASQLPETKEVLGAIYPGADGWTWVSRVSVDRGPVDLFDVFDERGRYLGPVSSPVPIELTTTPVFGSGTVLAVTEDELGVQYIVRLPVRPLQE
ncbi:MAG: hypothetical protein OXU74_00565 [Gemmatimonadota bacterium]|nr:hypothetical protein [Gemmatimonadota bacterium]